MRQLSVEWQQYATEAVALAERGGDVRAHVASGRGKRLMVAMRAQFASFVQTEEALGGVRVQAAQRATRLAIWLVSGLAVLLGGLLAFITRRQLTNVARSYTGALAAVQAQTDALREREERFRSLIEHSSDGIMLIDAAGKVLYASPSTKRILGFTPEELVGRDVFKTLGIIHLTQGGLFEWPRVKADVPR